MLTLATSAQNRGGSAVRDDNLDHRMEFFDPKTRPAAIFWDSDALLTAPPPLARSTGCSVYWRSVMNLDFPRAGLTKVLENSLKNFNADPGASSCASAICSTTCCNRHGRLGTQAAAVTF